MHKILIRERMIPTLLLHYSFDGLAVQVPWLKYSGKDLWVAKVPDAFDYSKPWL